jgi:hypothetical protein
MTPPPSEKSGLAKDLIVILGLPGPSPRTARSWSSPENGRPVYELAVSTLDGTPVGTAHFVGADLYRRQTWVFTGEPFVLRAIIGYYECFRTY